MPNGENETTILLKPTYPENKRLHHLYNTKVKSHRREGAMSHSALLNFILDFFLVLFLFLVLFSDLPNNLILLSSQHNLITSRSGLVLGDLDKIKTHSHHGTNKLWGLQHTVVGLINYGGGVYKDKRE